MALANPMCLELIDMGYGRISRVLPDFPADSQVRRQFSPGLIRDEQRMDHAEGGSDGSRVSRSFVDRSILRRALRRVGFARIIVSKLVSVQEVPILGVFLSIFSISSTATNKNNKTPGGMALRKREFRINASGGPSLRLN
jgi:hypothetical protein